MSMSNLERNIISEALLKYCELDTLAMVMIYEVIPDKLISSLHYLIDYLSLNVVTTIP